MRRRRVVAEPEPAQLRAHLGQRDVVPGQHRLTLPAQRLGLRRVGVPEAGGELLDRRLGRSATAPTEQPRLVTGEFSPQRLGAQTSGTAAGATQAPSAWTPLGDLPIRVTDNVAAEHDGTIYSVAGRSGGMAALRTGYAYDVAAGTWSRIADMPNGREKPAAGFVDGKLYVAGGRGAGYPVDMVEQLDIYDPAADAWSPLPNANSSVYRGAGACGFHKIGGASGGLSGTPFVEVLPGNADCGSDRDAGWLSVSRTSATLRPGQRVELTVRLDARDADQPGTFAADLLLRTDTPYRTTEVPVTMAVAAPRTWGLLTGTVTALSCTGAFAPLAGATVTVGGRSGDLGLRTGADGSFARWLPVRESPLALVAAIDGYLPATATARLWPGRATEVALALDRLDCVRAGR